MCSLQKFLRTSDSWSLLVLRLSVGGIMLPHGLQKIGLMGDGNWAGSMGFLTGMGIPTIIAALVIIGESVGALSLILGFLTRFCAASIGIIMIGAIALVHGKNGFSAGAGGFEYQLLITGCSLALTLAGGGKWSLDRVMGGK
jgi:putative oxidoreductase